MEGRNFTLIQTVSVAAVFTSVSFWYGFMFGREGTRRLDLLLALHRTTLEMVSRMRFSSELELFRNLLLDVSKNNTKLVSDAESSNNVEGSKQRKLDLKQFQIPSQT